MRGERGVQSGLMGRERERRKGREREMGGREKEEEEEIEEREQAGFCLFKWKDTAYVHRDHKACQGKCMHTGVRHSIWSPVVVRAHLNADIPPFLFIKKVKRRLGGGGTHL